MLDAAPFSDVVELRKEIAGKHCLHEPDRASPCQFAHAQARCETHDLVLLAQGDSGEMLALRLSTQAKPERSVGWKNLWLRFRHRARVFNPYQAVRIFQLQPSHVRWQSRWTLPPVQLGALP